jgi:hypothetical protein
MLTMKRLVGPLNLAAAALLLAAGVAQASTTSDQAAAVVIYPKVVFNTDPPTDTIIEIANASTTAVNLHCFYVNATSHCTNTGLPCDSGLDCGAGSCVPGWSETDFSVTLTHDQPFYWLASTGRNRSCVQEGTCEPLPLVGLGVCDGGTPLCTTNADCGTGGHCNLGGGSNAGTLVPPVSDESLFVGELKCATVDAATGLPLLSNQVYGTATIVTNFGGVVDAQSYNAVGVQARTNACSISGEPCDVTADCGTGGGTCAPRVDPVLDTSVLELGLAPSPYEACPETLILDHIFDGAPDPVGVGIFVTDLTLVPCSEDFATGAANLGRSTAQFLVFNEFEQRFSASQPVTCFDETLLSNIDTRNNTRSIFSVNVSGTIAGQSRIRAVGSGLLGVARTMKPDTDLAGISEQLNTGGLPPVFAPGAGYELHQQGERDQTDEIVLP